MVLHIGNNRAIPWRDIIAVLDVKIMRGARGVPALEDSDTDFDSARSVVVYESGGQTRFCASPISAAALRSRSLV